MDTGQLQQFETLCQQLHSTDAQERKSAESNLAVFGVEAERIPQLQFVLERSSQPYAQHFAALSILKLVGAFWNNFTQAQRLEVRNYALTFLANKGYLLCLSVFLT